MFADPIRLIRFASLQQTQSLQCMLKNLGYRTSDVKTGEWFNENGELTGDVFILVIGDTQIPIKDICTAISKRQSACLTVLYDQDQFWPTEILACFKELVFWPCSPRELNVRLDLLQPKKLSINKVANNSAFKKQLMQFNMIGNAPSFIETIDKIEKIALYDVPVLLFGETGTGKELVARAIHYSGGRADHPFIPVNCGAMPDNLIVNELFGHSKGAYTDARQSQPGLVDQANGGTLFLDEIDSLSLTSQATLLRFLENYEYRALGNSTTSIANIRVIAATNVKLSHLCDTGKFRRDFYYRLNIVSLNLAPLRARVEDIQLLTQHFLKCCQTKYKKPAKQLDSAVIHWMMNYPWPGNIRQLENLIHRCFLLSSGPVIYRDIVDEGVEDDNGSTDIAVTNVNTSVPFQQAKANVIENFEKQYLSKLMAESHGNVTLAAKRARKERRAFGKLIKKHQLARSIAY
jgi:DNA-binding NtrC family response regulator